jgi:type IV pilus assembly protein PilX
MTHHEVSLSGHRHSHRREQQGAVLFVALIFLILMTLLALAATGTSIMQERMTGGMRNRQLGLLGAESGLRGGEQYLWQLSDSMVYDPSGTHGQPLPPCVPSTVGVDCVHVPYFGKIDAITQTFRTSTTWLDPSSDGARAYPKTLAGLPAGDTETASLHSEPRFMVESLGFDLPSSSGVQGGARKPIPGRAGTHVLYRITARSQGGSDAVVRVAESVFSAADMTNSGI